MARERITVTQTPTAFEEADKLEPNPPKTYRDNWAARLGSNPLSQCQTCMYYLNKRCRWGAPRGQEGWPAVYPTDFCGRHKLPKDLM